MSIQKFAELDDPPGYVTVGSLLPPGVAKLPCGWPNGLAADPDVSE